MDSLVSRLEAVTFKICGGGGGDREEPVTVSEWNTFYQSSVQPFIDSCNSFEELKSIGAATETAMKHTAVVIEAAAKCSKPDQAALLKFLDPIVQVITSAESNCDNRSDVFPQQKSFAEAIQCLNWLMAASSKPIIMGQLESADFYLTKCLTKARDLESPAKENMRGYVSNLKKLLTEMGQYGQDFHKLGLQWKTNGIAIADFKPGCKPATSSDGKVASAEDKLASCVGSLEAFAAKQGGGDDGEGDAPCVTGFNDFYSTAVQPFLDACNAIDGTKRLGGWAEAAFKHLGVIIKATTTSKKPSQEAFMKFLGPIADSISAVMALNPHKNDEWFNHETSFSEGLQSLNWLCLDSLPRPFITGQLEAADFYLTKILTVGKDKDDTTKAAFRAYVKTFKDLIAAQAQFAVEHFKTGLSWNAKGGDLPSTEAAKPAANAGAAISAALAAKSGGGPGGLAAALAARGAPGGPKKGLAKFGGGAKAATGPTEGKIDRSQANKIFIEKYDSRLQKEPVIVKLTGDDASKTGVFIGNCKGPDLCIKIEGKFKNLTISNCHQCGIVFDNCITTVEVIGSKRCQIQAIEVAGSYVVDKCDRTQLFLAETSVAEKVVVYSAQSTSTNVLVPEGEDQIELAIPDQMISTFKKATAPTHDVVIPDAE